MGLLLVSTLRLNSKFGGHDCGLSRIASRCRCRGAKNLSRCEFLRSLARVRCKRGRPRDCTCRPKISPDALERKGTSNRDAPAMFCLRDGLPSHQAQQRREKRTSGHAQHLTTKTHEPLIAVLSHAIRSIELYSHYGFS